MSEPFVAEIQMFGFSFAPRGWAICAGQLLPISQNQALFSLLGTTYGGNGITTFGLPDLRGRVPVHAGSGAAGPGLSALTLGEVSGVETVTLQTAQLPAHSHAVTASAGAPNTGAPAGNTWATGGNTAYVAAASNTNMSPSALAQTGGNQAHENRQPSLVLNFCIALQGIFPSRS